MKNTYDTPLSTSLIETVRQTVLEAAGHVIIGLKNDMTRPVGDVKGTLKVYGAEYHSQSDKFTNFKVPAKNADSFQNRMKEKHNVYSSVITEEADLIESVNTLAEGRKINAAAIADLTNRTVKKTKDGNFRVAKEFFYRHGRTSGDHADSVCKALTDAGVKHTIVDHGEVNNPFRGGESTWRNSHHWVDVKVHPDAKITEAAEPIEELSKATLGRYIKAASTEQIPLVRLQDRQYKSARDYPADSESAKYHAGTGMKTGKKLINRVTGLHKATDKLTKENKED